MLKKIFNKENMGITPGRGMLRFLITFFIVIAAFLLLLTLAWSIPQSAIETNYNASLETFEEEGDGWDREFTYASGSMLDRFTDQLIVATCGAQDDRSSALYNAMSSGGYSRYWHGYAVILRPLFLMISYTDIRYILMLVFAILACICINGINKRISVGTTFAFSIGLALTYFNIVPFCIQFSSVYMVMLVSMAILLYRYNERWSLFKICQVFLVIGMITQFFDLLTAPLMTLGMPLAVILMINIKENRENLLMKNWCTFLFGAASWAFGWAGGWFSKWVIGDMVLKNDLLQEAFIQASYRTTGESASKISALWKNIYSMTPFSSVIGKGEKLGILIIGSVMLIGIIAAIIYLIRNYAGKKQFIYYIPLLCLGLLPYVWFLVMAQHSQVHSFFTYRIQIITCFAWIGTYLGMIRRKKQSE